MQNSDPRNQDAVQLLGRPPGDGLITIRETDRMLVLSCEQFTYVFNKLTGLFDKMTFANDRCWSAHGL